MYLPLIMNMRQQQAWVEVGPGLATEGGISDNDSASQYPALAIGPDGTPYIAWQDGSVGNFEIYLRQWNGSGWEEVSSNSASGGGITNNSGDSMYPSAAIGSDGSLYLAWQDDSSGNYEIYVRRWAGSQWKEIGTGSASGGGISKSGGSSENPSMAIAPDGEIYVAWHDNSSGNYEIYVLRWNGSEWEEMGVGSASGGGISDNSANSWDPVLAMQDSTPYIAWHDHSSGNAEIYVLRWNGTQWEEVGSHSASNGGISNTTKDSKHPCPVIAPDGTLYITWYDWTAGEAEVYVLHWDGSEWKEVGDGSASDGGISNNAGKSKHAVMAIAPDGTPYVAWHDDSSGNDEIYVRRWK